MNRYYQVQSTPELTSSLTQIDQLKAEIHERQSSANNDLTEAIQAKLRYLWTYNSNAIEGGTLSLGDTIFFLQEGLTVQGKPFKDFLDARNHAHAIDYVLEVVREQRSIDVHLIRSLNALLLMGVETIPALDASGQPIQRKIKPGQYKKLLNHVIQPDESIHEYVASFDVSQQMNDLCQWLHTYEQGFHPVIIAAVAHYNMLRIHPFDDGNEIDKH